MIKSLPHPCDAKTTISGTDTVHQVRLFNGSRILVPVEVDFVDHVCSVCGALHHRNIVRQRRES
jgi:hypothetical protein